MASEIVYITVLVLSKVSSACGYRTYKLCTTSYKISHQLLNCESRLSFVYDKQLTLANLQICTGK